MPGVGKTTIGKLLAEKLNYAFCDLDALIEKNIGQTIPDIFKAKGEAYFRKLESNALMDLKEANNLVVSTGGGIVENINNKSLMSGIIIYLSAPLATLEKRASATNRPLLRTNSLEDLYRRRENKYYYFAKHIINNENVSSTVTKIIRRLKNENFNN